MPDVAPHRPHSPAPRATLVMTVRERHRLTLVAIESILANTAVPFRFVFAHGELPEDLDDAIAKLVREGRIESRRFDGQPWPQQLREALIQEVDTEYAVFIDNDVLVSAGWLERLIQCADETGAGAVGPLYLWGDGVSPPKVHMAGGILKEYRAAGGNVMMEEHRHIDGDPARVAKLLGRGRCDFLEFHCMLVRTVLAREARAFDGEIACVHEHIDVALALRGKGGLTYFEPAAQVTYLAFAPHVLQDLGLLRARWNAAATEASIAAFCRKWDVIPDERSFGGVRGLVRDLRARNDPIRASAADADHTRPMSPQDLPQTRAQLLDLARARGYSTPALTLLSRGCHLAAALTDGGFRPCGRPFVQHLIGTAGVLVRYDFCTEVVLEGLLHAAYTHRRIAAVSIQGMLAGLLPAVERRVRDYTRRAGRSGTQPAGASSLRDVEVAAVAAANEIDMRLSGEYDYSGRPAEIAGDQVPRLVRILELLGVRGMASTLDAALVASRDVPRELVTGINMSYRIGAGNTLVRMAAEPGALPDGLPEAAFGV